MMETILIISAIFFVVNFISAIVFSILGKWLWATVALASLVFSLLVLSIKTWLIILTVVLGL